MTTPKRDYKAEYQRRIAKGRAAGKTRQEARGHARGEAANVRQRPKTPEERQEVKERSRIRREYADQLSRNGKASNGNYKGVAPFKRSLANPRVWDMTGTVIFTFQGQPLTEEISPKLEEMMRDLGTAYQAVPMRFDVDESLGAPYPLGRVYKELPEWIERARSKTSLQDPELADIYVVRSTLRRIG